MLIPASALNEKAGVIKHMEQDHLLEQALDNELIKQVGWVLLVELVDGNYAPLEWESAPMSFDASTGIPRLLT